MKIIKLCIVLEFSDGRLGLEFIFIIINDDGRFLPIATIII